LAFAVAFARVDGEAGTVAEAAAADDEGATERTPALGPDAFAEAALCPPSVTISAIMSPAAANTPITAKAPDRKLISSMRALIARLNLAIPVHPLTYDIARYRGISRFGAVWRLAERRGVPRPAGPWFLSPEGCLEGPENCDAGLNGC
jgi:hypothetical protein